MPSYTILTVSKRNGWFERACEQVAKQTVKPDKWIIVPEGDFGSWHGNYPCPVEFWPAPPQIRASNLNASLNEGLRHVDSEYVIFYQDFIDLNKNSFAKLLKLVDEWTFVTTCTPNYDGSNDDRFTGVKKPRICSPREWETNVAIAPMKAIHELGGFEEELDNGWSWDNVNLAERASMIGYGFICDESNRPKLLPHEQTSKLNMETNAQRSADILSEIERGIRPIKCNYL